uniref:7TM_GPCR_Srx domain-containing protein n=1 Tax=Caenorhabditis tropicalis TaxID=1561998 RepID=A0A1I7TRT7_9PELO
MPRKSNVAPAICIIEPTLTSNITEPPEVKVKKAESTCKGTCGKLEMTFSRFTNAFQIIRTLFYVFVLTAIGLGFNLFVGRFTSHR